MFKSKILATLTLILAAAAVLSMMSVVSQTAFAADGDNVFVDEGDGDFDAVPAPAPSTSAAVTGDQPADVSAPADAKPKAPAYAPVKKENVSVHPAPAPRPAVQVEPAANEIPKLTEDNSAPVRVKATGSFVTTLEACPMMRSPASTGETMLTVKASRKIWVEDAGGGWLKAYNKAGEPGYVAKECVH